MFEENSKKTEMVVMSEKWEVVKLSKLLSLEYGEGLIERERTGDGFPVYGSNGIVGFHKEFLINGVGIVIGRKGTIGSVTLTKGSFWAIDTTYYINLKSKSYLYWIYYLLIFLQLNKLDSSTGIPGLNRNDVYDLEIPLPPLPEQHRIASILSTVDETIEHTGALIEKYRNIKKGLMADLLTRGIDEEGRIRSEETHRFRDSPLGRIPEEWEVNRIGYIVIKTEQIDPTKKPDWLFKYVDVSSIFREMLKINNFTEYFGKNAPSRARQQMKKDDILFSTVRPYLKQVALVTKSLEGHICSTAFCVIRCVASLADSKFVFQYMTTDSFIQKISTFQAGTNYPAVTDKDVLGQVIPLPPLPEQDRIAEILTTSDERIKKEEAYRNKLLQIKKGLMQDLLTGRVRVNKYNEGKYNV